MVPLDGGDWLVDVPAGQQMVIRFAPRNNFGVLDYEILDIHDGELVPDLALRKAVISAICRWQAATSIPCW